MPRTEAGFRVILVDDDVMTRHVLRRWFTARGFGVVVGEGGTAAMALELVTGLLPDGVVLDDDLPDGSGLEIVPQLLARSPSIRVVMFTGNPVVAREARNRGAVAGVFKGTPGALEAVRLALVEPHPG
jgi:ActR/RegA family two-component response regulator